MSVTSPDLLPVSVANEIVQSVTDRASALMRLARLVNMPTREELVPVVATAPAAGFVGPDGLKPIGVLELEPASLLAREIAVVVALDDAFVEDTTFDPWGAARDEIIASFTRVFELTALYARPEDQTGYPQGGITDPAFATAVTGSDPLDALDAAMSALEDDGVTPTGILAGAALKAALRKAQIEVAQDPFGQAPGQLFGVPILFSGNWDDSEGIALVGGFESVIVGVRRDLTWLMSNVAVLVDAAGKVRSAFQRDETFIRCFWRLGLTVAKPLGADGDPVNPLALATVGSGSAAARSKTAAKTE